MMRTQQRSIFAVRSHLYSRGGVKCLTLCCVLAPLRPASALSYLCVLCCAHTLQCWFTQTRLFVEQSAPKTCFDSWANATFVELWIAHSACAVASGRRTDLRPEAAGVGRVAGRARTGLPGGEPDRAPENGLQEKARPAVLQAMNVETLLMNPDHAESKWARTPEMPVAFEWLGVSEMSVAFEDPPRLSCQASLRTWTTSAHGILKNLEVSKSG